MNYRKFGNTNLLVSEIGFGAWGIGGGKMIGNQAIGYGDSDDEVSKKAILNAVALGINFFDTADIYGLGHSEELIGNTIGNREDIIIATKVGNVSKNSQFTYDYTKEHILNSCEASLKRLKRDVIDYYQLHTAKLIHLKKGDCIEAMERLQQSGKIKFWGVSLNTFDPFPEANYLMNNQMGHGFQLVLNILNQSALPLIRKAASLGFGLIARMPLQFGLLTGKFNSNTEFSANDHRKKRLTKEIIDICNQDMEYIWLLCDKYKITKAQLALSYILSYPAVSTVIPGIRTSEQAENNTSKIVHIDEKDMKLIENTDFSGLINLIQKQG